MSSRRETCVIALFVFSLVCGCGDEGSDVVDATATPLPTPIRSLTYIAFADRARENLICTFDPEQGLDCRGVASNSRGSSDVALVHLNGDRVLDLVFAGSASHRSETASHTCLGQHDGTFLCSDLGVLGESVAVGDLNADPWKDAVIGSSAVDGGASFCLGTPDGLVGCEPPRTVDLRIHDVAIGDLNEDGSGDLVVAGRLGYTSVCLGDGLGGFQCERLTDQSFGGVVIGDVNRDSHLDAVFSTSLAATNQVCLGNGSGALDCNGIVPNNTIASCVDLADLDGDGFLDIVFGNFFPTPFPMLTANTRCLGDGLGEFSCDVIDQRFQGFTSGVALGDIDLDGDADAVFANPTWDPQGRPGLGRGEPSSICLGNNDGSFICQRIPNSSSGLFGVDVAEQ